MAWSKPFDAAELEYIRSHYAQMGAAQIAASIGRSERGVRNAASRIGLTAPCGRVDARRNEDAHAPARDAEIAGDDGPQDELAELREIKRVLKRTLRSGIAAKDMPKLSAELREVIRRISEIEEGDGDGGGGSLAGCAGNITVTVPLRPA